MSHTILVVLGTLSLATGAQTPAPPAAPAPVEKPDTGKKVPPDSLTGYVLSPSGKPLRDAIVTLSFPASGKGDVIGKDTSDAAGAFGFDSLGPRVFKIEIEHSAMRAVEDTVNGQGTRTFVLPEPRGAHSRSQTLWTLLCLVLYGLSLVCARWFHIAKSLHAIIRRQLTALKTRLATEVDVGFAPQVAVLQDTVRQLREAEDAYEENGWREWAKWRFFEMLFWSRGHENATWIAIHEIERQLAAFISPNEQVDVYLRWAESELRQIQKPTPTVIADEIHRSLATPAATPADCANQERYRRALLGRAIAIVNAERDDNFSTLMEWQSKAGWLILASMIIILFLTGVVGRGVLFLAGASGGFVSRVSRALKRDDVPLDYGASWATIWLSPFFGAFTGWFGVALIVLAASSTLNLLGPAFRVVDWDNPFGPITLGIAFVLGFSERFFDSIVGAVEDQAPTRAGGLGGRAPAPVVPPALPQGGVLAAGAAPAITAITRQSVSGGAPRDVLQVRGTGFDKAATASINGTPRQVEFQTPEALLILLTDEDVERIETGGESSLVVANPGGAASAPTPVE